ncbi:uncharacterized protein LOC115630001 [Scaptodrosophila lebanonensis]|uniref:Uncharacterized protein LOC115630001 n=1 Tax=Drosophila lebanonensis TaxID=7225 RepID=A0A6J2U283_DROLE|nr:uncharacterized protein LOC115630001 [Scaptodrosophila lebanonensis]
MNEALYKAKSKTSDGGVNKENIQKDSVKQKLSYSSEVNNNEVELYKELEGQTSDGGVNKENIQKDSVKQKLSYSSEVNNNEVELYKELEGQTSDGGVNKENIQKDFEAIGADGFDPILNSTEHSEISSKAVSGYTDTLESLGSNWPESATYDGINSSLTINESFSYEAQQVNFMRKIIVHKTSKMKVQY